jgi:hypothetical protein
LCFRPPISAKETSHRDRHRPVRAFHGGGITGYLFRKPVIEYCAFQCCNDWNRSADFDLFRRKRCVRISVDQKAQEASPGKAIAGYGFALRSCGPPISPAPAFAPQEVTACMLFAMLGCACLRLHWELKLFNPV